MLTSLSRYDERGVPFEAFVYSICARKVADVQAWLSEAFTRPASKYRVGFLAYPAHSRPHRPKWSRKNDDRAGVGRGRRAGF